MNNDFESIKNHIRRSNLQAVLIGCSYGGLEALELVLSDLRHNFPYPIIICQHLAPDAGIYLPQYVSKFSKLPTHEATPNLKIKKGQIYFAPGGYHLLIEKDLTFSLDVSEKVSYCRPSINVLLESAVDVYNGKILAIILSGANEDGCLGIKKVYENGGIVLIQEPETARAEEMPAAAIRSGNYHLVLSPKGINELLIQVVK